MQGRNRYVGEDNEGDDFDEDYENDPEKFVDLVIRLPLSMLN